MSTESPPNEDAPAAGNTGDSVMDRVSTTYHSYVGEPASERDIYAGFGAFFAGIGLGVVALIIFLISGTQTTGTAAYWQLRELALFAGLIGLPLVISSIVVLLPVGRRTQGLSALGLILCVVATALLVNFYPYDWTQPDGLDTSVITISVYAIGLVLLAMATGTALVAQYLDNAVQTTHTDSAQSESSPDDNTEAISKEAVENDIEQALDNADLSWGGVDTQQNTKRLNLDMPETETDLSDQLEDAEGTTTRAAGNDVDEAVSGLRGLQGGETETARSSSPDDQVAALSNIREQQEADDELETGVEEPGLLAKIRQMLFG